MTDQMAIARVLGRHAAAKIRALQTSLLAGSGAASAQAREALAQLRRFNGMTGSFALANGAQVFGGWPEQALASAGASPLDDTRASRTVSASLGLYALHQQSSVQPVACIRAQGESDEEFTKRRAQASFGRACRQIEPDLDEASGVRSRLMAIEAAADFDGMLTSMRALVRLMKSARVEPGIALDYEALTRDLYLAQLPGDWRRGVMNRWSHDYYVSVSARS